MADAKSFNEQLDEMVAACFSTANPTLRPPEGPTIDGAVRFVASCGSDATLVGERIKAVARLLNGRIVKSTPDCVVVTGSDGDRGCEIRFEIDRGARRPNPFAGMSERPTSQSLNASTSVWT